MENTFSTVTLPVSETLRMDATEAHQLGELLAEDFVNAEPFPFIVVDDFLPSTIARRALKAFPDRRLVSDGNFELGYAGLHKRQIQPEDCGPDAFELFRFLNSGAMLQFLEGLTGIEGLIADPYFVGGGYHETTTGGLLGVHADFRLHEKLNLQRRLNLIIYLNEAWDDNWKGHLELWSRDMSGCVARISPQFNRAVVFRTDADTWHGHPDPLQTPAGVSRRSIALYYYTASGSIRREVPGSGTVYVSRPEDSIETKREARYLRAWETLRDWAPPVVYRGLTALRYKIERRLRRSPGSKS